MPDEQSCSLALRLVNRQVQHRVTRWAAEESDLRSRASALPLVGCGLLTEIDAAKIPRATVGMYANDSLPALTTDWQKHLGQKNESLESCTPLRHATIFCLSFGCGRRPRHAGSIRQTTYDSQIGPLGRSRNTCSRMMKPLVAARPGLRDGRATRSLVAGWINERPSFSGCTRRLASVPDSADCLYLITDDLHQFG